ncbi:hypothetical protein HDV06_003854 [Boothiomyces sp. JEL0866]|nr:hypothetical protein HDV06_003854 [Boothiomyces sp. JEL0866]
MEKFGPSLPPHLQKRNSTAPVGPTKPQTPADESDSDDDYGPVLPDVDEKTLKEQELQAKIAEIESRASKPIKKPVQVEETKSKREDWMLVPPEAKRAQIGLEQKSKTFSRRGVESTSLDTTWTETPQERERRLADTKRKPVVEVAPKKKVKELEPEEKPKSLLEEFQENMYHNKTVKADDISHKRFDRERDIVGRRVDTKSRDEMLNDAKNLSSKFSKGSN